jgi:cytochrome c551/c552
MPGAVKALTPLALCAALLALAGPAGATTTQSGGTWGNAEQLPGIAALNTGGGAQADTMYCASAGNCVTAGSYTDSSRHYQSFVAGETNGTWGSAQEVPGTAALNASGNGGADSVWCASAGNCTMTGSYQNSARAVLQYVATETDGTWQDAQAIPGLAALNAGDNAGFSSVSCAAVGNCSIDGTYTDESDAVQLFVAREKNGVWASAQEVPGLGALNQGGYASPGGLSCRSAGDCVLAGDYATSSTGSQAFIATEKNGVWGPAKNVPGFKALNQGGNGALMSLSCASTGNCTAGGTYTDAAGHQQAVVVDETDGTWGDAQEVPGTAGLNVSGAYVQSVSCASAGNCGAVGTYTDAAQHEQAFVVSETGGAWGGAEEIPGTAGLNTGNDSVNSVSCGAAGDCSAIGWYPATGGDDVAFVVSETGGTWGNAEQIPGLATLYPAGGTYGDRVACRSAGHCSAAGDSQTEVYVAKEK